MNDSEINSIAGKIAENPFQWVLVMGDVASGCKVASKREEIIKLAKKFKGDFSDNVHFYDYIIKKDYKNIADMIFGTVWDEVSFLDNTKECQMKIRKKYARIFGKKENANVELVHYDAEKVLQAFPGIILTICQDEMLEVFWESKRSMSADERIWVPYEFTSPVTWNRWVKFQNELESVSSNQQNPEDREPRLLVKLYGDCRKPSQMLLSSEDFELYFPKNKTETYAKKFLREIFKTKNIIFWGADTDFIESAGLPFAPGISTILELTADGNKERYIFIGENSLKGSWEKYNVDETFISENSGDEINSLLAKVIEKQKELRKNRKDTDNTRQNAAADDVEGDADIEQERVRRLFWELYIRRVEHDISDNEKVIIEKILSESESVWNKKNMYLLSMIANNQADFYDLQKIINDEKKGQSKDENMTEIVYYQNILQGILMKRLGEKSKELLSFLAKYGSGFPLGFFQLLSADEEGLKEWKRAGFQLTNSGVYIQRKTRKHLQKRMEYADLIIEKAKLDLEKTEVSRILQKLNPQLDNSYFYPLDENYFTVPVDDKVDKKVEELFNQMFRNLLEILKDKREGYHHIRSLLETEVYNIVKIIMKLEKQSADSIPQLLYYLLRESKAVPVIDEYDVTDQLQNYINGTLMVDLEDYIKKSTGEDKRRYYQDMIMAILSVSIMQSQSDKIGQLDAALGKCKEAEKVIEQCKVEELVNNPMSDIDFFRLELDIFYLESKIYERKSMLMKAGQCVEAADTSQYNGVDAPLCELKKTLECLDEKIETRGKGAGNDYKELRAEYHNRAGRYAFICRDFKEADDHYKHALEYYEKYPNHYILQLADVKRNMADLCYGEADGIKDEAEKNKLKKEGCCLLLQAYMLYRKVADLHGIADVMQSFANVEDFSCGNADMGKRSSLSFYNMAINLYRQLGDGGACFVAVKAREKFHC